MKHFAKYDASRPISIIQAQTIWTDETLNTPAYDKTALYTKDDMNTSGFLWFEDAEDLHFFLKNVWPVVLCGEDLPKKNLAGWRDFVREFDQQKTPGPGLLDFVSSFWQGDIRLSWTGTLTELESSIDDVPATIREWFHESEEQINESDKEEFIAFIKDGFC